MRLAASTLAVFLSAVATGPVRADETEATTGKATVLDSDTLSLAGRTFRLAGADGMEYHQFCFIDGQPWACGTAAIRSLQALVDPVTVTCTPTGERVGEVELAQCSVGGLDIAEILVADGWALARDTDRYGDMEAAAKSARKGIWQGAFVEPWEHRDNIAAIESRLLAEAAAGLREAAELALLQGTDGIDVLDGFEIVEIPRDGQTMLRQERTVGLGPGFIEASIPEHGVFAWGTVAERLKAWQDATTAVIQADALGTIWLALLERPGVQVEVSNAGDYYAALTTHAALWLAQGRQPVLLVVSPMVPSWMPYWLGDEPPRGAVVTQKPRMGSTAYLGSIDGIDIYIAPVPDAESLLLPDDLLAEVGYTRDSDGHVLEIRHDHEQLTVSFGMELSWRDDKVVWLQFPRSEAAILDER